jgi:hypothetical protein
VHWATRPITTASTRVGKCGAGPAISIAERAVRVCVLYAIRKAQLRSSALFDAVQRKVKNVVVVQRSVFRALAIGRLEWPRQQERNLLFCETTVGAKAVPRQLAEIMILSARPNDRVAVAEHGEVPLSIKRQVELRADLSLVEN